MQPTSFLLFPDKELTSESIESAQTALQVLPLYKMKNSEQMLSETLYILSVQWNEDLADKALLLANLLIKKGADPDYKKLIMEHLHAGNSSTLKTMIIDIDYTETACSVAQGSLREFFLKRKGK